MHHQWNQAIVLACDVIEASFLKRNSGTFWVSVGSNDNKTAVDSEGYNYLKNIDTTSTFSTNVLRREDSSQKLIGLTSRRRVFA